MEQHVRGLFSNVDNDRNQAPIPITAPLQTQSGTPAGTMRFPVELDADDDPSSNPISGRSVPVYRLASGESNEALCYAVLRLGVELLPTARNFNPTGTPVLFHVWNESKSLDLWIPTLSDEWGAAAIELPLAEAQLGGSVFYEARSDRFGNTLGAILASGPKSLSR